MMVSIRISSQIFEFIWTHAPAELIGWFVDMPWGSARRLNPVVWSDWHENPAIAV
ncbi:MAG: hypothetical protein ACOH1M_09500 [Rhodoglobus sp.]